MNAFSRVLTVAIAAAWVFGAQATAQSKNPIQAAKDAYKKAREEQQAKKPQQPPAAPSTPPQTAPTSQPSNPALSLTRSSRSAEARQTRFESSAFSAKATPF